MKRQADGVTGPLFRKAVRAYRTRLPTRFGTVIRVAWNDPALAANLPSDVLVYVRGKRSGLPGWENLAGCWGAQALHDEISGYEILARPTLTARIRGHA